MSDNENGDELVTKPFKFVTGKLPRPPKLPLSTQANTPLHSWYAAPTSFPAPRAPSRTRSMSFAAPRNVC
jgi:hypothetical protein